MKNQFLLAASAVAFVAAAAVAGEQVEQKVEKNLTCTSTVDGGATKTICTSDDGKTKIEKHVSCKTIVNGADVKTTCSPDQGAGPAWEQQDGARVMIVPSGGHGQGDDVDVQVFNDGKTEKRIVIVRHGIDSADANKDGKVSRKEFLARAEKHFAEMDKNGNGSLEGDEMRPPMPPLPPIPGVPPMPPAPPAPPTPPTPPAN